MSRQLHQGHNLTFNVLLSKDRLEVGFPSYYEFLYYHKRKVLPPEGYKGEGATSCSQSRVLF